MIDQGNEERREAIDARRWRKLAAAIKRKDLGTSVEEDGHLRSPLFRRFYIDDYDLTHTTIEQAVDGLKEKEA